MSHIDTLTNQCDWCNFCDFSKKICAFQEIWDRNMCDSCNLCDFIKSDSKCSHINNPTKKLDWCNLFNFSNKNHLLKLGTVTCVICIA